MESTNLCIEKHKRVDEILDNHEERLNDHAKQIDSLNISDAKHDTQIDSLCGKIGDLVVIIKWFIGLLVGSFIGFFFYAVQQVIFK